MPRPSDSASPGIVTKEIDLTSGGIRPSSNETGAIVAPFAKGPVDIPTLIENESQLINVFGDPYPTDKHYEHWYSASSYLNYGGQLLVVRCDDSEMKNGYIGFGTFKAVATPPYICAPEIDPDINYDVTVAEYEFSRYNIAYSQREDGIIRTQTTPFPLRPLTFYTTNPIETGQSDQWIFRTSGIPGILNTILALSYGKDLFVIGSQSGSISASTDGIAWVLRTSGIVEPTITWTDGGFTTVATESSQITGTSSFKSIPNTGQRITTSAAVIDPTLLQVWRKRTSGINNSSLLNIIFGDNLYVYSTGEGYYDSGTIATSTNAVVWTLRTAGTLEDIRGLVFGNNTYVYSAGTYPGSGIIATSTNAIAWTLRTSGTDLPIRSLVFGNNIYVAGGGFSGGVLTTSTDAITWTLRTSGTTADISKIIYANSTYVYAANTELATSTDAITWTLRTSGYFYSLTALKFLNNTYLWGNYYGQIATSTNAIVWTLRTAGNIQTSSRVINDFMYSNNLYVYVGGSGIIKTSTNAIVWTNRTSNSSYYLYSSFADANNVLVGGEYGTLLSPSSKGDVSGTITSITNSLLGPSSLTFSSYPNFNGNNNFGNWKIILPWNIEFAGELYSTIYINANSYITFDNWDTTSSVSTSSPFIPKITISGTDNSCKVLYSGIEGTSPNRTYRIRFEGVNSSNFYGSTNMIWEAIFYENSPNQIDIQMGSNERQTPSSFNGLNKIIYQEDTYNIPGNDIFVGIGYTGTIASSTDSITWELRTSGLTSQNEFTNIIYQNSGNDLEPPTLVLSTDGSVWSRRTSGTFFNYNSIVFGNNTYVVGGSGLITSTNGISWTSRTASYATLTEVLYQGSASEPFIGVGDILLVTSTNAIVWTYRTTGTSASTNVITYGNNTYLIAGSSGTIMSSTNAIVWTFRTSPIINTNTINALSYGVVNGQNVFSAFATPSIAMSSTDAVVWTLRTSGIEQVVIYSDNGFTGVCSASSIISGTSSFSSLPNTGKRITTTSGSGTVTTITSSLLGPASLTASTSNAGDDNFWTLTLPFNISFNGTTYSQIFVGTNSYITFGSGSSSYSGLSASNPALPKIMISAADNSGQRIYYGTEGVAPNRTYRVRFEGTNSTGGTIGSPTMVYEATFYEASPNQIDIQMGVNARQVNSSPAPPQINKLRFLNQNFIGTGNQGTNYSGSGAITISTDSIHWILRTSGVATNCNDVSFGNGFYVVGCNSGYLIASTDTISWRQLDSSVNDNINSITFNQNTSIFTFVGSNGMIGDSGPIPIGPVGGPFVAASNFGNIITSTNAIVWKLRTSGISSKINSLTYGTVDNKILYILGGLNGQLRTSTDAIHWRARTSPLSGFYANRDIIYVDGITEKFIAVNEYPYIMSSTNAIVWTARTGPYYSYAYPYSYASFNSLYFNNTSNEIIAVGDNIISYSTDGIVWEGQSPAGDSESQSPTNKVKRLLYENSKNRYIWTGELGKLATSSIQNSLLINYEHGYTIGDDVYFRISGPGTWQYNGSGSLSFQSSYFKTVVIDVLSQYEFKIKPLSIWNGYITGVCKIQRPVWKSGQYLIDDKWEDYELATGEVVTVLYIQIVATNPTQIISPVVEGDFVRMKILSGSLDSVEIIESPAVNDYSGQFYIAIIETPELQGTTIGDSGNLLFFPSGMGGYADCEFLDNPSGFTLWIIYYDNYDAVIASGLSPGSSIYIEDSDPFYGESYNGNVYGIHGNSGWYTVQSIENPEDGTTYIYVNWPVEAPKYEYFYGHVRWDITNNTCYGLCNNEISVYSEDIESEYPIICPNICQDVYVPQETGVKIKSVEHYRELGYDDNALSGYMFASRNPGSWSNGIRIAVIDSKADQILSGISTNEVQVGYGITQSISGTINPGIGQTSLLNGYLGGIITGIGTASIDVKLLEYVDNSGVVSNVDYQRRGIYKFSNSGMVAIHTTDSSPPYQIKSYSSQLDWYDQQVIEITPTETIKWNSIAPKPKTSKYAEERNCRFDELHILVIDSLGSITGNNGTILEKHLNLSKASDAEYSVGSPSYWRKYIEYNSEYIFALDTPTYIDEANESYINIQPDCGDGGGGGGPGISGPKVSVIGIQTSANEPLSNIISTTPAIFRFVRNDEFTYSAPLTINVNWSGTANQNDFVEGLPSTINFPVGVAATNLIITPVDDMVTESTETAIITIADSVNYTIIENRRSATAYVYQPRLNVNVTCTNPNASEPVPDILDAVPAVFRFSRSYVVNNSSYVSFNSPLSVDIEWSGTANQSDFEESLPSVINFAAQDTYVDVTLTPASDVLLNEPIETITATITQNPNYTSINSSATATVRDVDTSKSYRLFVSVIDEDDGYSSIQRQSDWNSWTSRPNPSQNILIVLRPMPQYGAVTKPIGWNGIEYEVTRPGEGGPNTNYAQLLAPYLNNAYFIQFAVDDSGSMVRNTVAEDIDAFIQYLSTTNIIYREVSMDSSENWIQPHLF